MAPRLAAASEVFVNELAQPRSTDVPAWLGAVVTRGLEVDPARRYPSMTALLADLSRQPERRRGLLFAVVGIVAVAAVGSKLLVSGNHASTCRSGQWWASAP